MSAFRGPRRGPLVRHEDVAQTSRICGVWVTNMEVTDLQGQSWPAAWKRAVFAVGFAYLVAPWVQGFWEFGSVPCLAHHCLVYLGSEKAGYCPPIASLMLSLLLSLLCLGEPTKKETAMLE